MPRNLSILSLVLTAAFAAPRPASAAESVQVFGGRLAFAGDASFSFAQEDTGYFNYTDYANSALRLARLDLDTRLQAGDHVAFLAEIRTDKFDTPHAYGLYLRLRHSQDRSFTLHPHPFPPPFLSLP